MYGKTQIAPPPIVDYSRYSLTLLSRVPSTVFHCLIILLITNHGCCAAHGCGSSLCGETQTAGQGLSSNAHRLSSIRRVLARCGPRQPQRQRRHRRERLLSPTGLLRRLRAVRPRTPAMAFSGGAWATESWASAAPLVVDANYGCEPAQVRPTQNPES